MKFRLWSYAGCNPLRHLDKLVPHPLLSDGPFWFWIDFPARVVSPDGSPPTAANNSGHVSPFNSGLSITALKIVCEHGKYGGRWDDGRWHRRGPRRYPARETNQTESPGRTSPRQA